VYSHSITWQYNEAFIARERGRYKSNSFVAIPNYLRNFFLFYDDGRDWAHFIRRPLMGLFYQPRMIRKERGSVGGVRLGRRNRSTMRKLDSVILRPPQISHSVPWDRTRATAVRNPRPIAWCVAWPTNSRTMYSCLQIVWLVSFGLNKEASVIVRKRSWNLPYSGVEFYSWD
jgi:hypothetical protein